MKHLTVLIVFMVLMIGCADASFQTSSDLLNQQSTASEPVTTDIDAIPKPLIYDFMNYIGESLPHDIYANYVGVDEKTVLIWCVDQNQVQEVIGQYHDSGVSVIYQSAKYPLSVLQPIFKEIVDLPVVVTNMEKLNFLTITGDGIEISIKDLKSIEIFEQWLKHYQYKDYIVLRTPKSESNQGAVVEPIQPEGSPDRVEPFPSASEEVLVIHPVQPEGAESYIEPFPPQDYTIANFDSYLTETLSPNDYACTSYGEKEGYTIYCTNIENVKQVVEQYGSVTFEIIYDIAKYPLSTLRPILDEVVQLDLSADLGIKSDGIYAKVCRDDPGIEKFYQWYEDYAFKEYITVYEFESLNPS